MRLSSPRVVTPFRFYEDPPVTKSQAEMATFLKTMDFSQWGAGDKSNVLDVNARRRLLLSMRPLYVPKGQISSGMSG